MSKDQKEVAAAWEEVSALLREIEKTGPHLAATITLRDYLACQAMVGMLSGPHSGSGRSKAELIDIATDSYAAADAMLRKRGESK
jgi:hypothetical protein